MFADREVEIVYGQPQSTRAQKVRQTFVNAAVSLSGRHRLIRMPFSFPDDVVTAVLRHMNGDHTDDNALIVRAFADPDATSATMTGFDGEGGEWEAVSANGSTSHVRVPWPGGAIDERAAVRREVVALYDAACEKLGVTPRPH